MASDDGAQTTSARIRGWLGGAALIAVLAGVGLTLGFWFTEMDNREAEQLESDLRGLGWEVSEERVYVPSEFFKTSELEVFLVGNVDQSRRLCALLWDLDWDDHDATVFYGKHLTRWDRSAGVDCWTGAVQRR
jgi:hypothetical protein